MAVVTRLGSNCATPYERSLHFPSQTVGWQIDSVRVPSCLLTDCKPQLLAVHSGVNNLGLRLRGPVLTKMPFQRQGIVGVLASHVDRAVEIAQDVGKSGSPVKKHLPFYVMLPVDTVSVNNTLNHCKAIQAGLLTLKTLGVDGVVMQVWWSVVEGEAPTKYDWAAYLTLVKLIQAAGLKVQASMCFHGCKYSKQKPGIAIPSWVLKVGDSDPNIFFTDHSGNRYKDCLSLAIDDLPLFEGRSPLQMASDMLKSFRATFSEYIGNTIVEICVGLGPDGELKYPSFPADVWKFPGVGEFQCYDKHMLANLKQHSEEMGHPLWGLGGPHDAPSYCQWPQEGGFFSDNGGSWNSPYGDFFLSWYTSQLLNHGDRMLSLAESIFRDENVIIAGKLPAIHWWYKTKSHAAELTSGFYNVEGRDGYEAFVEMFAKTASLIILPKMDVSDLENPIEARCSPESLFLQIRRASHKYGVPVAGENSYPCYDSAAYKKVFNNVHGQTSPDLPALTSFTFSRMGASLFSPESWRLFVNFFRNIDQSASVVDEKDLPLGNQEAASCSFSNMEQLVQV